MISKTCKSRLLRWGPVVLWMGVIFCFSNLPSRPPTPGMEGFSIDDKLQHTGAYMILAVFWWRAIGNSKGIIRRALFAILLTAAYGAADEIHQSFVPGRQCALDDWLCDSIGAVIAATVLYLIYRRR